MCADINRKKIFSCEIINFHIHEEINGPSLGTAPAVIYIGVESPLDMEPLANCHPVRDSQWHFDY